MHQPHLVDDILLKLRWLYGFFHVSTETGQFVHVEEIDRDDITSRHGTEYRCQREGEWECEDEGQRRCGLN